MGAIQEPTPAMGPYIVEARRESFYLHRDGTPGDRVSLIGTRHDGQLSVPVTDAPRILAALTQAAPFAAEADAPGPPFDADTSAILARPWHVEADRHDLRISGPTRVYVEDHDGSPHASVEIPYDSLARLRRLLGIVAGRRP